MAAFEAKPSWQMDAAQSASAPRSLEVHDGLLWRSDAKKKKTARVRKNGVASPLKKEEKKTPPIYTNIFMVCFVCGWIQREV